jgi:hypothetical protein
VLGGSFAEGIDLPGTASAALRCARSCPRGGRDRANQRSRRTHPAVRPRPDPSEGLPLGKAMARQGGHP